MPLDTVFLRSTPFGKPSADGEWTLFSGFVGDPMVPLRTRSIAIAKWCSLLATPQAYEAEMEGNLVTDVVPIAPPTESASPAPKARHVRRAAMSVDLHRAILGIRGHLDRTGWRAAQLELGMNPAPPGHAQATGLSLVASSFAMKALNASYPQLHWRIAGGAPVQASWPRAKTEHLPQYEHMDGGSWNSKLRRWQQHYWLVGTQNGRDIVLDVCGDACASAKIRFVDAEDARFRAGYLPTALEESAARSHVKRAIDAIGEVVESPERSMAPGPGR